MTSGDTCCAVGCLSLAHELDTEDLTIGEVASCLGSGHVTMSRVYAINWRLTVISLTRGILLTNDTRDYVHLNTKELLEMHADENWLASAYTVLVCRALEVCIYVCIV